MDIQTDRVCLAIRECLDYNPETGSIIWINPTSNRVKVGDEAGALSKSGYRDIGICNVTVGAHRVAWFLYHNRYPPAFLDHKNGIRHDNRISNLRPATITQNNHNLSSHRGSTSRFKGVGWSKAARKCRAYIYDGGKQKHLGLFIDERDAALAYNKEAQRLHKEFARLN